MRITFVLPGANLSGGIRVIAVYAQRLMQRGHQVLVVHPWPAEPRLRDKVRSVLRGQGWPVPHPKRPTHFDGRSVERHVLDRERRLTDADVPDADVIIATWWETGEWIEHLSANKGAKVFFAQGYEIFDWLPIERVKAMWAKPMHKIVVSQWLAKVAREQYGDDQASLVPNAVDPEQFTAPPRDKQPAPTVGLLYCPAKIKGCDVAFRAYQLAKQKLPDLRLRLFGSDPPTRDCPLPPEATFELQPPQARLREIYASCDAWLFSSRNDGFGLPLLEAMACRTPIIATPTGAAPELTEAGAGLLVPMDDAEAMADAIGRVCGMPNAEWRTLSARAHAIAQSHSWEDATDKFAQALQVACARAERGELGSGQGQRKE
jgi:glycosyltransferase involved in cell wall biosynthesis